MKNNFLKSLILITTVLISTVKTYGYAEVEQSVTTDVQPSVAISKLASQEAGTIDPTTGASSGLNASFKLQTNGNDENYDFVVSAKINTIDGEVSAYGQNGCLLFGNTIALPTSSAIENAKMGNKKNPNVIAYPLNMSITSPMSVEFGNSPIYGDSWIVKVNSGTEGTLTQSIGQTPINNTYSIGEDEAGTYSATVTFTAISK